MVHKHTTGTERNRWWSTSTLHHYCVKYPSAMFILVTNIIFNLSTYTFKFENSFMSIYYRCPWRNSSHCSKQTEVLYLALTVHTYRIGHAVPCSKLKLYEECLLTHTVIYSSFLGLEVACWTSVTKFAARSRVQTRPKPSDSSGRKNPQHAFLRKGSKAVCPMS